jgi:hypothetical protein
MIKRFKGKDLMMIVQNEINKFIRMIGCSRYVTAYLHIYDRNNYTVNIEYRD